jgi:hypothetical protein
MTVTAALSCAVALVAPGARPAVAEPAATSATGPSPSYASLVDDRPGLLAHWRLGDAGGPTAHDTTGTHNGTYSAVALGSPGAITNDPDTAASFSAATGSRVSVPPFAPVVDFTVEGWTNLDEYLPATNKTLYGGLGSVRILVRDPPTSLATAYASVWLNGTEYVLQPYRTYTNSDTNHDVWVHWALTRQANVLTLYRNGLQIAQRSDLPATAPANLNGAIGVQSNGSYPLTGRIDEVALYSNALSAGDVADDYQAGVDGPPPFYRSAVHSESSLLSYWRLGETSGTTAGDLAGTNSGTYSGVTLGAPGALDNDPDTAASLNGSTSRVSLPSLGQVGDFTVEGWTNLTSASTTNNTLYGALGAVRLLARPGAPYSPTAAYAGVWLNGTEYALQPRSTATNIDTWVYWVMTRRANTLTLYRNGVQIGQRTDLPPTATATLSGALGAQGGSTYFLTGRIDEVAIYTSALDSAQIDNHYNAALHGPPEP